MKDGISRRSKSPFKKLPPSFFRRPATELARALIGKVLVRHIHGKAFQARVVETEAYLGPHDLASHASKGRTRRTVGTTTHSISRVIMNGGKRGA
jgi:3-methyladenine DNA glycosylase Mpg